MNWYNLVKNRSGTHSTIEIRVTQALNAVMGDFTGKLIRIVLQYYIISSECIKGSTSAVNHDISTL